MSEPLLKELRAAKPVAPDELRERVRAIAATDPRPEPFLARLQWRRRLVLLAPATLVAGVAAAGVIGLTRGDTSPTEQAAVGESAVTRSSLETFNRQGADDAGKAFGAPETAPLPAAGTGVVPTPGRLQRYEAELRLRVNDVEALSSATKRAQ